MKLLGTGLTGLVGSRIVELLSSKHTFTNYSLDNGVDITHRDDILTRITSEKDAPWMLHLAAYTNVQQAETDRAQGEKSNAWQVNVLATQHIVDGCRESSKRLLYIDTDYAFDGTKKEYSEDDVPHPLSWYAVTKSEGAKLVQTMGDKGLVIRISNPYRASLKGSAAGSQGKTDFVHKMLERLQRHEDVIAPADQLFVPTFIDDIAIAIDTLIQANASGIYHVVGSQAISPFDTAKLIAQTYAVDGSLVKKISFQEYFTGRAPVPQYAVLTNRKISSLGITMSKFTEGIQEVRRQEKRLYSA